MQSKELRIGNIVERLTNNGEHVDYELVEKISEPQYGVLPSSRCLPVALTDNWLQKLGAKPMSPLSKDYWLSVPNLKAELHFETFSNSDEIVTTLKSQFSDLILDRIKYVHELQNLFYCLTKHELQVLSDK